MLSILLEGNDYKYEIGELLKLFLGTEKFYFIDNKALAKDQSFLLVCTVEQKYDKAVVHTRLLQKNKIVVQKILEVDIHNGNEIENRKMIKRMIKVCIFEILSQYYHIRPPWGILTGIRPTKIVHELIDKGFSMEKIKKKLREDYKISDEKIKLVTGVAQIERPFLISNRDDYISLYISIPFCPTRCLYCSFPSNLLHKGKNQVASYLKSLFYELQKTGELLKHYNKKIQSVYIGGGTPTILSPEELILLMENIRNYIDLRWVKEFTVEAGRPDTISEKKLNILKNYNVNRISINPQTMNQKTLERIGRTHSTQNVKEAFMLARQIGFPTINMDIIIGLPEETVKSIEHTMQQIEELKPENLTVHTLAIKRTSKLKHDIDQYDLAQEEQANNMLKIAEQSARKMGLRPYYMYRQKYMVGNLENIGYSKQGHECIYNIQIMEERQTIIAVGAGAISKIYYKFEDRLERVPNVTNIDHYINRIEEMIERKRKELNNLMGKHIDMS